jgi:hypothetical protein
MTANAVLDPPTAPWVDTPVLALARREAGRMLRHPAYLAALGFTALVVGQWIAREPGLHHPAPAIYVVLEWGFTFCYAPMTIVAANRVARSTMRHGLPDQLRSTPVDLRKRTVALCAGAALGPAALALGAAVVALALSPHADAATAGLEADFVGRGTAALVHLPVLTLGAGLLGIMIARWLPYPGALPLAFLVTLMVVTASGQPWAWFKPWHLWYGATDGSAGELPAPQDAWHAVYLLGLCALAFLAALWRTPGPRRTLAAAGVVVAAVTAFAGIAQLP